MNDDESRTGSVGDATEQNEWSERDRLITKGRSVLDLCIDTRKVLCVQGFVDSQIERGGVHLEVVEAMRDYLQSELEGERARKHRVVMKELHAYVSQKLEEIARVAE